MAAPTPPTRVLLCKPSYFEIRYAINPWMMGGQINQKRAQDEFAAIVSAYDELGLEVLTIEQEARFPDMVFTANAGLLVGNVFIPSNFRFDERAGESALFAEFFASHGKSVRRLDSDIPFEGAGDAIFVGPRLFLGYGFRSAARAADALGEYLPRDMIVSLGLCNPYFFHLDTCLAALPSGRFLYYPDAFDDRSRSVLRGLGGYWVTERFCVQYGCNMVIVGRTILTSCADARLREIADLEGLDIRVLSVTEFVKAGGGLRCLSFLF